MAVEKYGVAVEAVIQAAILIGFREDVLDCLLLLIAWMNMTLVIVAVLRLLFAIIILYKIMEKQV